MALQLHFFGGEVAQYIDNCLKPFKTHPYSDTCEEDLFTMVHYIAE